MGLQWVGEAALSAAFQSLFERIASFEFQGRKKHSDHLDKLVKRLKLVFESVTALLEDAEEKQMRDKPGMKGWLDELQDAAYDADDLLDEIEYEALKFKVEADHDYSSADTTEVRNFSNKKRKYGDFFFSFSSSNDPDMESKIKEILEWLECIVKKKDGFDLKESSVGEKPWRRLPSTSLVDDSEIYGRDDDKDVVIKLVMSGNHVGSKEICVIPIVGMAGVGKTTLAQAVFNDDKVKQMFELQVWVCVSVEFDVCKVTKTILEVVTSHACDVVDLNSLQVKLKKELERKKFLIVLDDVWNENHAEWDVLKRPFKDGAQGSKIIVTTRSKFVSSIMGTVQTHYLKELTEQDCWQLFSKRAFGNIDFTIYPELVSIGKKIVKKCKGSPLAAKTLGGLLRSTLDVAKWDRIASSDIWELKINESDILPALRLSYHYLPSYLKRCFAYCSIFPKDYEFDKKNLVLLWMAENLLEHPKGNKRVEEVGDEYFNDLVSRSFFQPSSTRKSIFVMHDLMHDLAKFVSRDYCLLLEDENSNEVVKKVRHLACIRRKRDPYLRFNFAFEGTRLRTFLPNVLPNVCFDLSFLNYKNVSAKTLHDFLSKSMRLRVLSLKGYKSVKELPDIIGELRHVRYLDLSDTSISMLPESVTMLYNLRTLKLRNCFYLKNLPKGMRQLINLRYVDLGASGLVEMPRQLGQLKNLQMLSTFIVGKDNGTQIGELRELSSLGGGLHIRKLENVANVKDASDQANLMDKKHLETLRLEWSGGHSCHNCKPGKVVSDMLLPNVRHERDVLDMLLPSEALKELQIHGYSGTEFSNWVGKDSFCNIVSMELSGCKNCLSLPPLGQLPSLKILKISGFDAMVNVGVEFYGNSSVVSPFSSLEILNFSCMSSWEQWNSMQIENERTFANLKELEISCCNKLIGNLPCNLPSLEKLRIKSCEQLDACENLLLQEMEEYPRHLSIEDCSSLTSIGFSSTTSEMLTSRKCEKLELALNLPYESLENLDLWGCNYSLRSIPLDSFPNLKRLAVSGSKTLESLTMPMPMPDGLTFPSLSFLEIEFCPNFVSFPKGGLPSPNLTSLIIVSCGQLESLPERMHTLLPSLRNLVIISCPAIDSFPKGGLPINLGSLHIGYCDKLIASRMRVKWNLQTLPNLTHFEIWEGTNRYEDQMELFPEEGLLPPTITRLSISEFPSLKALNNNVLQQLSSLKELHIYRCPKLLTMPKQGLPTSLECLWIHDCPNLRTLPAKGLPTSLKELSIRRCLVLKKMCEPDHGEYWTKIAHIPIIDI